jgi:hypothetical protein
MEAVAEGEFLRVRLGHVRSRGFAGLCRPGDARRPINTHAKIKVEILSRAAAANKDTDRLY